MPSSYSLLMIEDDELLGDLVSQKLTSAGYAVRWSKSGEEGLEAARAQKPDLILLDILLPRMNGYDVLQALYKEDTLKSVPVIILSNLEHSADIAHAISLGARGYVVKSTTNPDQIVSTVGDTLRVLGITGSIKNTTPAEAGAKKNLLMVEDEPFLKELLELKLKDTFNFSHANDGSSALKKLRESRPDVVLLDILLPGINGFEILKKIRESKEYDATTIIMLTNFSSDADRKRAADSGADEYWVKADLDISKIKDKILEVLSKHKTR